MPFAEMLETIDAALAENEFVQEEAIMHLDAHSLVELNEGGKWLVRQVFESQGVEFVDSEESN